MRFLSKEDIRNSIIKKRDSFPSSLMYEKSILIKKRLLELEEFKNAGILLLYASFRSEPDTHELIQECLIAGKRVFLPRVNIEKKELEVREITSPGQLKKGYAGILEPDDSCPLRDLNEADIIIVPGVAFDRSGGRIGYGSGYYDKLLAGLKKDIPVIAIAYDEQIVEDVCLEGHDRKVDMIITDREVIYCGHKKD
ncbi:MAG: 5-formyltetrahydrofolate cyclo-ligase [Thermodesulfovibrionales bacterium]|nr:5-formyltetrahydrofolate cyclo-ligase [Thermodesulfovibrionales bacterium]